MSKIVNYIRALIFRRMRSAIDNKSTILDSNINGLICLGRGSLIKDSNVGGNAKVSDHVGIFECNIEGNISVGRYTTINGPNTNIFSAIHSIDFGRFCSIAPGCAIYEVNHVSERCTTYNIFRNLIFADPSSSNIWSGDLKYDIVSKGSIVVGNDVWIGTQSCITSGVTIGDGAIIGANSVVTTDIPPYAIAAGNPAKVIKYRFDADIIKSLLETRWWLWDDEKIRRNHDFFDGAMTMQKIKLIKD